ncbi:MULTISPECIES: hydroxysqualene dehydroxylase HpnE [unclassified Undibacterium]|uniref:hydroxysqualene dehydroxylase HpnE n=1 Tax=unclassified Undibacterium TaxID=2630295 RepID=UPI002AC9CD3A|nr:MULTISPECIES: hydroxysqualene dehydroxylase HpnE [unclassified Undibacterium]MEB0138056.1 hydroxysqualene dehydroxylase HpnE [Undibacterium sp. CCC2.1]MEB0171206.1 hydroxysqualene dehydroxylase HpnE [Undibacterium sp. CCC1.1]MEB0175251.1 hydroxysqualene dehydroxylase HpnE [Undibacterium sp. CCC3.4]MEB0214659.1 hydroxysqualene dehydroxylase HpnE [Undibacterium sp. 5I2]WPX42426.1 hydroxysqualene dehydroxylase HpnE [Undibacterium sp. CCC3.4]
MLEVGARDIAVIGAGWAGCAAAIALNQAGHRVSLFEATRTAGGRARRVELQGMALDNGQHLLLGAYRNSLAMLRQVGIDPDLALLRLPLQMIYPPGEDGMHFLAPRSTWWPAPLHLTIALWQATGLTRADKMALARFSSTARWMDWQLNEDCSVTELLQGFEQSERLCRLMWVPLCLAALNTPPEQASAQIFLHVLRDSLGARRAASDMLIPRMDLSSLFPQRATEYLLQRGAHVHFGQAIRQLQRSTSGQWQLSQDVDAPHYDGVIVACDPDNARRLLQTCGEESVPAFEQAAICTCYLQYRADLQLARPLFALRDDVAAQAWGQYVFDRGQLDASQAGLLAVVISAAHGLPDHSTLAAAIAQQLALSFAMPELAAPRWSRVITEKRATFNCKVALARPDNQTGQAGLLLAGDYTAGPYPSTLEGAVNSGLRAAALS